MRGLVFAALALACLATPGTARAHLRSGTVAVDYQASVRHPDTTAYSSRIFQSDRALGLTVKPGHTIVLVGLLGEPVFRLDGAGLWVNQTSPTAAADRLVAKTDPTAVPGPRWRLWRGRLRRVAGRKGAGPPGRRGAGILERAPGRRPAPSRLVGQLHRLPSPLLWPWLALLAAILTAAALPMYTGRANRARVEVIGLALLRALASAVLAVAVAFDAHASPGTWVESADGIVFIAIGGGLILRGPRHRHAGAAIGIGLLGVGIGVSKGVVLFHPDRACGPARDRRPVRRHHHDRHRERCGRARLLDLRPSAGSGLRARPDMQTTRSGQPHH